MVRHLAFLAVSVTVFATGLSGFSPARAAAVEAASISSAIAYSAGPWTIALGSGSDSKSAAKDAEKTCTSNGGGDGCQAVGWVSNGYLSFATSSSEATVWGVGFSGSQKDADGFALDFCKHGPKPITGQARNDCAVRKQHKTGGSGKLQWGGFSPIRLEAGKVGQYDVWYDDHRGEDAWAVDFVTNPPTVLGVKDRDKAPKVYPTKAGTVAVSKWDCSKANGLDVPPCYGNVVVIDHGKGLYSLYTHLCCGDEIANEQYKMPKPGKKVTVADSIGIMWDSGCPKCGKHVHYVMRKFPKEGLGVSALYGGTAVQTPWRCRTDCLIGKP